MSKDRSPEQLASDFADVVQAASADGLPATALTSLLHIGDEHLVVLSGLGAAPETVHTIDLGTARIARDFFHHDPPTSGEIERAIDFAEDEIMRLGKPAAHEVKLWGTGPAIGAWAAVSGRTLSLENIEQWFQRLAAASRGQPGAMQGLPAGREAAAKLLILREFMHHLGHPAITVADAHRAQD